MRPWKADLLKSPYLTSSPIRNSIKQKMNYLLVAQACNFVKSPKATINHPAPNPRQVDDKTAEKILNLKRD